MTELDGKDNAQQTVHVYIIAANRLLREALTRRLRQRAQIDVVGASESLPPSWPVPAPQVFLVSGGTSGQGGPELARALLQRLPNVSVVLFGMEEDLEAFFQAVRAGVAGYLLSEASAAELVEAVRAVARGEAVCPPRLCRALFRWVAHQAAVPNPQLQARHGLTRREQQLLPLLARGLTNKEIANQLCLAEQTVKNHVHRILRKLGSSNRLEAVRVLASGTSLPLLS